MKLVGWSVVLQWSRVGITAALFLIAARILSLAELGLFATAFAPVRLTQSLHRAGIGEAVIVYGHRAGRCEALFLIATASGLAIALVLATLGILLGSPLLTLLAVIPIVSGFGAVSEGQLRRELRIKALAVRTLLCQSVAAGIALWMLLADFGVWALAAFAVVNAGLSSGMSIWLSGWRPRLRPQLRRVLLMVPKVAQISLRDLLNSGLLPVAQLLVAAGMGLTAAGAFQIAVRLLGLIDALTLAPLRFTALPSLRRARDGAFADVIRTHLRFSATVAAWVWGGTLAVTMDLVSFAVGADHATASSAPLVGLAGLGLVSALTMPVTQALMARGHTGLVLKRASFTFGLGFLATLGLLWTDPVLVSAGLSLSALAITVWFFGTALPRLGLGWSDLQVAARPLAAGVVMVLALRLLPSVPLWSAVILGTALYAALLGADQVFRQRVTA